jgi:hypothetical protein
MNIYGILTSSTYTIGMLGTLSMHLVRLQTLSRQRKRKGTLIKVVTGTGKLRLACYKIVSLRFKASLPKTG